MQKQDTDDWVDKLMLLAANYSKPFAEEWFKLCQWFLVLAALSFLSKVSEHGIYIIALGISMIFLWAYFLIHYQKIWYQKFKKTIEDNPDWGFWKRLFLHSLGAMLTLIIASGMLSLAMLFGSDAFSYLHIINAK